MAVHVRFHETLPLRIPEWISASMMTLWGWVVLTDLTLFASNPSFAAMTRLPQWVWGDLALFCGLAGLVGLGINGFWRATPFIRAVAAGGRMLMWLAIVLGLASSLSLSTGLPIYFGLVALECWNIYRAMGDARIAMR